ncbi:glycosyltransferase family 2 protein [Clostridium disporicum]|uniref:Putative glycosyltransferase EpsJ n=1 Tax=Clostridium disporicum TaxID=84024 RepID=A0A174GQQ2_9CLOT|nr:glycosyltransferase [Clostridium disporicum]CUO65032.1 putative glycosyltransferase EpsJ [Clostridium disporicum]
MKPLVSVIVPVYNVEKYLNKCVDSIINQTLKDIEIILVNDGSTDNCPSIIDEYAKSDNRIIAIHKENGGQGSARNAGLDIARGEYIGFVDSDDWIDLNMYEELYESLLNNNADIAICSRQVYYEDYSIKYSIKVNNHVYKNIDKNIINYITSDMIYPNALLVTNKLYKAKLIKYKLINFENIKEIGSEDTLFNYKLLLDTKKIVSNNKVNYNQLFRNGSTMRTYNKGYLLRLSNLIDKIIEISDDYRVATIFYIHFMGRYSKLIIEFSKNKQKDLIYEYKDAMEKKTFIECTKNVLVNKDKILNKLGYRSNGIIIMKIKALLLLLRCYGIRAKLEQMI